MDEIKAMAQMLAESLPALLLFWPRSRVGSAQSCLEENVKRGLAFVCRMGNSHLCLPWLGVMRTWRETSRKTLRRRTTSASARSPLRASSLLTPRLGFPGCLCLLQLRKDKSAFLAGGGRALRQVYTERGEPGS